MSGILVVGEALVDVVRRPDGTVTEHPGGSPANVAIGLGRLGREVHLLTQLGDDAHGALIAAHLKASGVDLVDSSVTGTPTSTATALLDADGSATYTFDLHWALPRTPLPAEPLAVHVGSIGAVLQPGAATVERILHGAHGHATITYDPNLRPDLMGEPDLVRAHVESFVASADVVKLSEEDATWLAPDEPPVQLVQTWLRLGPSLVVLTCGARGFRAVCAAGTVEVPAEPVQVVDTVGAGDSAMAGLLDGLWDAGLLGADARGSLRGVGLGMVQRVLEHAARVAALTVSRPGADPPTREDLLRG
ncbi:MAG TPA: carbohydrate kinase [Actinomycetales bacterium]|nr:carbohydrate kinase [Actinomycetales bacterium]